MKHFSRFKKEFTFNKLKYFQKLSNIFLNNKYKTNKNLFKNLKFKFKTLSEICKNWSKINSK